jgi:hypothetical protein
MNSADVAALNVGSSSSAMRASGRRDVSGETDARRKSGAAVAVSDHAELLDGAR